MRRSDWGWTHGLRRLAVILGCALTLSGCQPAWLRYENSVYASIKESNQEAFAAHAVLLKEVIEEREAEGRKPPPGVCAEYAYYLARLGRGEESHTYLAKEVLYYPESRVFVAALERLIAGEDKVLGNAG